LIPIPNPPKKCKTDFSEFLTSVEAKKVPDDVGDPFLIHDDSSIDGLPKNRNKNPPLFNFKKTTPLDLTPSFSNVSPFNSPFQFAPKKSWAEIAGCSNRKDEEPERKAPTTAASSDSGSSPVKDVFPWNLNSLKDKSEETKSAKTKPQITKQTNSETEQIEQKRRRKRLEQIRLGKETSGYKNYIKVVPRAKRRYGKNGDIFTPDWTDLTMSKRRFEGAVKAWRKRLHDYDEIDEEL